MMRYKGLKHWPHPCSQSGDLVEGSLSRKTCETLVRTGKGSWWEGKQSE